MTNACVRHRVSIDLQTQRRCAATPPLLHSPRDLLLQPPRHAIAPQPASMSRGYAQIHEDKILHLAQRSVPQSARGSAQPSRQHSPRGASREQHQQQRQQQYERSPQQQQQHRDDRGRDERYDSRDQQQQQQRQSYRDDSRSQSQQHSPQHQQSSRPSQSQYDQQQQQQQQQRPSTARPSSSNDLTATSGGRTPTTFIPGFPHMSEQDARPKTAAGSGGEKTLRHRMFPFHDLPQDGDPHRSMLRSTAATAAVLSHPEHEEQRRHGTNVINHPFVANPPAYTKPPPPRASSELHKLIAPEHHREELASADAQEAWSTKHKPRYAAREAATSKPTALDPAPPAPLHTGKGRVPNPANPGYNDPTRAGLHSSREIQWTERTSRGIGQFSGYSDAKATNHLSSQLGGSVVPFVAHAQPRQQQKPEQVRDALQGHAFDSSSSTRHSDPNAGAGGRAPEHRPGSKAIAPQNLSLRQSNQVALILQPGMSTDAMVAAEAERRDARALKLNLQMRERDWGQHAKGYDIITLAGAGGQTGRDPVTDTVAQVQAREADRTRAGMSSVAQHRKMIPVVMGGQVRGSYTPNQVSSLTNQCEENPAAAGVASREQQWKPTYKPLAASQNRTSDVVWNALHGR